VGHGIAPHCARAATLSVMIRKTMCEIKVPNRAQEKRGSSIEDVKTEDRRFRKKGKFKK
jgi:hypothetical protein